MSILFASISKTQSSNIGGEGGSNTSNIPNGAESTKTLLEYFSLEIKGNNLSEITRVIQEKIRSAAGISQMSYVYDGFYFHFVQVNSLVFLCLTGEDFPRRKAFEMLNKLKSEFMSKVLDEAPLTPEKEPDFERLLSFHPHLEALVKEYSQTDSMEAVQRDIDQVRTIMSQNIEKVLQRGERIESIVDRTESLQSQAAQFRSSSRSVHREMWWKDTKIKIIGGCVAAIFLLLAILYFALGKSSSPSPPH